MPWQHDAPHIAKLVVQHSRPPRPRSAAAAGAIQVSAGGSGAAGAAGCGWSAPKAPFVPPAGGPARGTTPQLERYEEFLLSLKGPQHLVDKEQPALT